MLAISHWNIEQISCDLCDLLIFNLLIWFWKWSISMSYWNDSSGSYKERLRYLFFLGFCAMNIEALGCSNFLWWLFLPTASFMYLQDLLTLKSQIFGTGLEGHTAVCQIPCLQWVCKISHSFGVFTFPKYFLCLASLMAPHLRYEM